MTILPNAQLESVCSSIIAVGSGLFDAFHCHLFKNNFTPVVTSLLADFVSADFTGYAPVTGGTWPSGVYLDPAGLVSADGKLCHFQGGSPLTVPNTVYGYYLTDVADAVLLASARFANPVAIAVPLAGVSFSPHLQIPQGPWGT